MSIGERALHPEKYFTILVEPARSSNERMGDSAASLMLL